MARFDSIHTRTGVKKFKLGKEIKRRFYARLAALP
jgi:hypothetical protein